MPEVTTALVDALLAVVGEPARVSTGDSERDLHAADLTYHPPRRPDVVVYALGTQEVSGSSASPASSGPGHAGRRGHVAGGPRDPGRGGVSLDLSRMDA